MAPAVAVLVTPVARLVSVPSLPRLAWQQADPPARLARLAPAGGLGLVALARASLGRLFAAGQVHLCLVGWTGVVRVAAGSFVSRALGVGVAGLLEVALAAQGLVADKI